MLIIKDPLSIEILEEQIKIARNRMQQLWNEKGYTDNEVLSASIELDNLLNEYQRIASNPLQTQYFGSLASRTI